MITLNDMYEMQEKINKYAENAETDELLNLLVVSKLVAQGIGAAEAEGHIEDHQSVLQKLERIVNEAIGEE